MDIDAFLHIIVFACTVLMAVISFVGVRIFKNIDQLYKAIKDFQYEIDGRINNFRRDFDNRCDTVHSRLSKHGERIAKLETKINGG